jgi:hypothetical protein
MQDMRFPKIAILVNEHVPTPIGFFNGFLGDNIAEQKELYYVHHVFSVNIGSYIKRDNVVYNCVDWDGQIVKMRNLRLLDWLFDRVTKKIVEKTAEFSDKLGLFRITGASNTYQENTNLWARYLALEITIQEAMEFDHPYEPINTPVINIEIDT